MAATLQRLGLWILVTVLVLYVLHESYENSPVAEYVTFDLMQKALVVGALAIIAGVILRVLEKGTKAVVKNRCAVCRTPIPHGAIYCRAHLRRILHEEDDRTHMTRLR